MSNVVSFAEFKATRPERTSLTAADRWPQPANQDPSQRSVAHRQLMLAFLEHAFLEQAQFSEASPATSAGPRTGSASL